MTDDDAARPATPERRGGATASPRAGTAVQDGDQSPAAAGADPAAGSSTGSTTGSNAQDSGVGDSATTANLPAVGSPGDPYLDRNSRAQRGSAAAAAVGPRPTAEPSASSSSASSLPSASMAPISGSPASGSSTSGSRPSPTRPAAPSAVDQYAALGLGGGAATANAEAVTATTAAPSAPAPAAPPAPPAATSTARRPRSQRTPRRARLQLRHFNVWTVFKFSVVLAVALFFVWLIIVAVLYGTLDHLQTIDKINSTVRTIENDSSTNDAVTPRIVFTAAFLIGLVNIVLFIALTTIGAVVYNLCADLVGGIEVTLAERD